MSAADANMPAARARSCARPSLTLTMVPHASKSVSFGTFVVHTAVGRPSLPYTADPHIGHLPANTELLGWSVSRSRFAIASAISSSASSPTGCRPIHSEW